jgi:hypothetical protein
MISEYDFIQKPDLDLLNRANSKFKKGGATLPFPSRQVPERIIPKPTSPYRTIKDAAQLKGLPLEMTSDDVWVVWRYEERNGGKRTKVPYRADQPFKKASVTEPAHFSSFDIARESYLKHGVLDGIGRVFTGATKLVGIDLDHCLDIDKHPFPWAQELVKALGDANAWIEVSPSGSGLKVWVYTAEPLPVGTKRKVTGFGEDKTGAIEVYSEGRYFTVTGRRYGPPQYGNSGFKIGTADLTKILPPKFFPKDKPNESAAGQSRSGFIGSDDELLAKIRGSKQSEKFVALYDRGDLTEYAEDRNAADMALISRLHFWCGDDPQRIDRIFRASKLMREKWDRPTSGSTYGRITIDKVIASQGKVYQPYRGVKVVLGTDEYRVADEVINALSNDPELYQRGNYLARVVSTEGDSPDTEPIRRKKGSILMTQVGHQFLREQITRYTRLTKIRETKDGPVELAAHPPDWLAPAIVARENWPSFRHIEGISTSPILRYDGSILQTPGYDPTTRTLLKLSGTFPVIPNKLSKDDAVKALASLQDVFTDFPLATDASGAAVMAALLTPLARHAFDGCAPLFLIDANTPGAGKTLIAQAIATITTGSYMPVTRYPHDPVELEKRITALVIAGDPMVLLDNISGSFGNDALDAAITATEWGGRVLGQSKNIKLPLTLTWYATGNNVTVEADTTRRIIHIRLDSLDEKPEERTGFAHPQLLPWVSENRVRLLMDSLTVLSAFCQAGRPDQNLTPYGSFEGWSNLIRNALVWAGMSDPYITRTDLLAKSDTVSQTIRQLQKLARLHDPRQQGFTVARLVKAAYGDGYHVPSDATASSMREIIESLVLPEDGKLPIRSLAAKLKKFRRKCLDGAYFDIDENCNDNAGVVWKLYEQHRRTMLLSSTGSLGRSTPPVLAGAF